jgi:hypothetical protein
MRALTVADVAKKIRFRTDQETSAFVSDAEILDYIDSAYTALYDQITMLYEQYNMTFATIITLADTQIYNLPANFYKLMGIDAAITGGKKISLNRIEWAERNNSWEDAASVSDFGTNLEYNILGNTLMLNPAPLSGIELTVWYTPVAPKLTTSTQIIDGINGWEEFIVLECCVRIYEKQEMDPSSFVRQKKEMMERMQEVGQNRDAGTPRKVSDSRGITTPSRRY